MNKPSPGRGNNAVGRGGTVSGDKVGLLVGRVGRGRTGRVGRPGRTGRLVDVGTDKVVVGLIVV